MENKNTKQAAFEAMRREYSQQAFEEKNASTDPIIQFEHWFNEAKTQTIDMPNAMTLATASANGEPHARVVLLKDFDQQGFVFFSHYESCKGQDLQQNPQAALLFYWSVFDRQIRINGHIERISREASTTYFKSRPIDSQISATVSKQSHEVESRQALEKLVEEQKTRLQNGEKLDTPEQWGGYRLKPTRFEFWQGRENRLHDRLIYTPINSAWKISRLAP